jgi:hypothetical protein
MRENQYIAVVRDSEKVIQEIPCTYISMNNVGGTQILGFIEGGNIGYETTLAVIPASFIVMLVDFHPYLPTLNETIENNSNEQETQET